MFLQKGKTTETPTKTLLEVCLFLTKQGGGSRGQAFQSKKAVHTKGNLKFQVETLVKLAKFTY